MPKLTTSLAPLGAVRVVAALDLLIARLEAEHAREGAPLATPKHGQPVRGYGEAIRAFFASGTHVVDLDLEEAKAVGRADRIAHFRTLRRMARAAIASGNDYLLVSTDDFRAFMADWDAEGVPAAVAAA